MLDGEEIIFAKKGPCCVELLLERTPIVVIQVTNPLIVLGSQATSFSQCEHKRIPYSDGLLLIITRAILLTLTCRLHNDLYATLVVSLKESLIGFTKTIEVRN